MIDTPELPTTRIPRVIEESSPDNKNCEAIVLFLGSFAYVVVLPSGNMEAVA